MERPVRVQLKHLPAVAHDREIARDAVRRHAEDLAQEGRLRRRVAHQQVQPDAL